MNNINFDINNIIINEMIITIYQPIISIKKKKIIGFEALARGVFPESDMLIPPNILFSCASDNNLTLELDRLCRKKALETYSSFKNKDDNIIFINFEPSILEEGVVGSKVLLNLADKLNINPNNIAIEILESNVRYIEPLIKFIEFYRYNGFLIVMDDVGIGQSNFERISILKPDIIKVDKSIIRNIDKDLYKKEILKSIVSLGKNIGSLIIAEGIEKKEEAIVVLENDVDFLQGFYFGIPEQLNKINYDSYIMKIYELSRQFENHILFLINSKIENSKEIDIIINQILNNINYKNIIEFESILKESINKYTNIEYAYILDMNGIQITNTISSINFNYQDNKNPLFKPDKIGADQSLKSYYLHIKAGLSKYISDQYISFASGNKCITVSAKFMDLYNNYYILCIDLII